MVCRSHRQQCSGDSRVHYETVGCIWGEFEQFLILTQTKQKRKTTHPCPHTQQIHSLELVDITSIILGLSVFGQWMGLLRFLSYFDKYNMLLLTLRLSMPSVLRFIVCAGILYVAFLLCGWLVFGPYHPKVLESVYVFLVMGFAGE